MDLLQLEQAEDLVEYLGSGKLQDKSVLITGGDSGIGRAVAVLMAREGADITIAHHPDEQSIAEDTKKMVEAENRTCFLFAGDLTNSENCRRIVDEHHRSFGSLNILVNNASTHHSCINFTDMDLNIVESGFRSNVVQMFAITKYALSHMKKGDSIINSTSVVTFRGSVSMVDFAATQGAIVGFTRSLAKQLIPKGIRVNAVACGTVYNPDESNRAVAKEFKDWNARSPLGRPGHPNEVAPTFVFLASPEASLYYGQILHCYPLGD